MSSSLARRVVPLLLQSMAAYYSWPTIAGLAYRAEIGKKLSALTDAGVAKTTGIKSRTADAAAPISKREAASQTARSLDRGSKADLVAAGERMLADAKWLPEIFRRPVPASRGSSLAAAMPGPARQTAATRTYSAAKATCRVFFKGLVNNPFYRCSGNCLEPILTRWSC